MVNINSDTKVSLPVAALIAIICAVFAGAVAWTSFDSRVSHANAVNEQQQKDIEQLKIDSNENKVQFAKILTTISNVEATVQEIKLLIRNQ